jgi:hypothetical protein
MLLGIKYNQQAVIHKEKEVVQILDTKVGRVLASLKWDEGDVSKWVMMYSEYLKCKYEAFSELEIVSLEKLLIPTRTDSLLRHKNKQGLAATRWVSVYNI